MRIRSVFRAEPSGLSAKIVTIAAVCLLALGCDKSPGGSPPDPQVAVPKVPVAPDGSAQETGAVADGEQDVDVSTKEPVPRGPESAMEPSATSVRFGEAASPEFKRSFENLRKWVVAKGGKVHAALVDLESDAWLLRADAETPINPASNAKILTAAAALELLGPAHQFATTLHGDIGPDGRCNRLVLKGGGAPDFSTADLWRLLRVAQGEGLAEVNEIVVDQSLFSEQFVPPAFEQQPNEWAPFRAPISALAINENAISLNVVTTRAGEAARVWYDPPGVVEGRGRVETSKEGSGDKVTWTLDPKGDARRPVSSVGGSLAEGLGRRRYERRMEDPRLAGGHALAALLGEANVKVTGKVTLGQLRKEGRIALWYSKPVAELIRALGKESDNFVAEMLFVSLSASDSAKTEPWSSERGAAAVRKWLVEKKVDLDGMKVENGSGLFDANAVSVELLALVLARVEDNPRIYQDFVSHLAMGATDGTLERRMKKGSLGQRIRAKTGTLRQVDALSGYVQRPGGKSPAAFSIVVSGAKASHGEVRAQIDDLVLGWAKLLE